MTALWFNEIDAYPAAWLGNLWPDATIDQRSIADVQPSDVAGTRAHFFAGLGGWEYALQLAGWPDDWPVWTGSCPCQPFSVAGRGAGTDDSRHLWPELHRLIAECRPPVVFGEQVAGRAGLDWLAGVRADLEALGYVVGAADLCAASVGAPHIRQRLYWGAWLADAGGAAGRQHAGGLSAPQAGVGGAGEFDGHRADGPRAGGSGGVGWDGRLADPERVEFRGGGPGPAGGAAGGVPGADGERQRLRADAGAGGAVVVDGLADAVHAERRPVDVNRQDGRHGADGGRQEAHGELGACGEVHVGAWADAVLVPCADGKARRVGTGVRVLAHGIPARAPKLRAYGNAIVPQVAAEFVRAFMASVAEVAP